MLYILNTSIIDPAIPAGVIEFQKLTFEEAQQLVQSNEFYSAVGHAATAELLTRLFGCEIKHNREAIKVSNGDQILAFKLKSRLPEGKIIEDAKELEQIGYEFILFKVHTYFEAMSRIMF